MDVSNSSQVRGLIANYLESIDVIDDRTLMFNHPIWPGDIIFDMFHFAQIHDADEIEAYNAVESFGGCSGPFMWDFDQYEPSERYTVVRNKNFYRDVHLDAIEVRTIADEDTRALALEAGEIDFATVNPDQYLRLGEMDHLTQLEGPAGGMWVMGPVQTHLGGGHPANDDPRFRLALHKAIDRERLHEDVFQGIGMSTNQMWLSNSPAYDAAFDKDPYDPEGARALVEESGWDGVEMDLFVSNTFSHQVIPEILQANLKDVGINITIVKQEVAEWVDFFLTGTFPGLYVAGTGFFWMAPETPAKHELPVPFPGERRGLRDWGVQADRRRIRFAADPGRTTGTVQRLERALGGRPLVAPLPHDQQHNDRQQPRTRRDLAGTNLHVHGRMVGRRGIADP